jgi:hypothetical protein
VFLLTVYAASSYAVTLRTPMMETRNSLEYTSQALFTVGENFDGYYPPGLLDGIGAYLKNTTTVRALVNHEISSSVGYSYSINIEGSGTFSLTGA